MCHIIVCMKIIIDPEAPFSVFKIDKESQKPVPPSGMPPVFSPFDENGLEAALRIKDGNPDCRITLLSMGKSLPKAILQKALAVGADDVIAVEDPDFENLDPFNTARVLVKAIEKIGEYDLIFTGRQAADWDAGIVWAGIAELLNIPSITIARRVELLDEKVVVERCVTDGIEFLESELPALVTFTNEGGELRNVSLSALMKVRKQEIPKWSATDVGFEKEDMMVMKELYEPDLAVTECSMISGESFEEKGRNLAKRFVEEGIIER
jgi:electron transfer flavoprotein beta subunit